MSDSTLPDDPSISDDESLWRRINPAWIVIDQNLGCRRPTSQAFQNRDGEKLSVLLAQGVLSSGRRAEDVVSGLPGYGLAGFTVRCARGLGQAVVRAPEPDEPAHCHIVGDKPKRVQRALAKEARWVLPPPDP